MEKKMSKIERIFQDPEVVDKETRIKIEETGADYELGVMIRECIAERRVDKTVVELKEFLRVHPKMNYLTEKTLLQSINNPRRDVDLLIFVNSVIAKLKVQPCELADGLIADSMEKATVDGVSKILEKIVDEESLKNAEDGLIIAIEKYSELKEEFSVIILKLLVQSLDKKGKYTQKSHLLNEIWDFLVN